MDALAKDIRFAFRSLVKRPVFTAVAVVSLALGIGANGAIFSLVNGMLLRPLPGVQDEDRLVRIYTQAKSFDFPLGVSVLNYEDIRQATQHLLTESSGAFPATLGLAIRDRPAKVFVGAAVVGDYFETLGTQSELGRLFSGEDIRAHEPLLVISHAAWQEQFGGEPGAIGETVKVNGQPFTVSGVAPPGFSGTEGMMKMEFWIPLTAGEDLVAPGVMASRSSRGLRVTGRLHEGVDVDSFNAALEPISANLVAEYPDDNGGDTFLAMPESEARLEAGLGDAARLFATVLMGLVAGVLLIACANVANLMMARAEARNRETSLRVAIGAGRLQLIRQHLVESLLLASAGGLAGLGLAVITARAIASFEAPGGGVPIRLNTEPDLRVYFFTGLVSLLAGVVFGLAPALRASRTDPAQGLRGTPGTMTGRKLRLGSVLVVAQVALSLILLIAAGLFLRSLQSTRHVDIGYETAERASISFDLSTVGLDEEEGRAFLENAERRLEEMPGVEAVTLASPLPMDWYANGFRIGFDRDLGEEIGDEMLILGSRVGADYFETMETEIQRGRGFLETDDREHPDVVIVNQALVDKVWPEENPLGRTVRLNGRNGTPAEVVGVVATGKYRLPGEAPRPYLYRPLRQNYRQNITVVVQSRQPLGGILERSQKEILALEPDLAIQDALPLALRIESRMVGPVALIATLAGTFGLVGLVLAAIGLYGIMALQVGQRTREIGVRMALGAQARQVLGGVLQRGVRLAAVGVVIGALLSVVASRVLGSFLVGVSASDPLTFVSVILLLALVATVASLVPALRAARIDPVKTLKAD